jgi:4-aminobutyrate aminotransferase
VLKCFKKGVVVIGAGKSTIRIAPPLIITEELLMKAIDIIEEALREVVNR